ncbi:MAG: hypothetical protein IKB48_07945, partial [Bacteroidales bacterium]|nr:hypothetical protein [Bacteroidales bacterium]
MEDRVWNGDLTALVEQVRVDMEEIAATGQYPVQVMLRGYELLERLGDWENVQYNVKDKETFHKALEKFRESYIACGEQLYAV